MRRKNGHCIIRTASAAILAMMVSCGIATQIAKLFADGAVVNYEIDQDRSSDVITDAWADIQPDGACDFDGEAGTKVRVDYAVTVLFREENGSQEACISDAFLGQNFREKVRNFGRFEHEQFKVTHKAYDGRCDTMLFYDIQGATALDDFEVTAQLCDGEQALLAEKLDLEGRYRGQTVKLGLDRVERHKRASRPF